MLIKCPECELQVSNKAYACPHCGYPFEQDARPYKPKSSKRKRLPNGFGQITKIGNRNLRNPYRAMVTVGKTSEGKPICRILKPKGYFATYNDAYIALMEYNKNPYDIDANVTVEDLYRVWSDDYYKTLEQSSIRTLEYVWSYCSPLYDKNIRLLKAGHIRTCMEEAEKELKAKNGKASPMIQARIKSLFNNMLDYAVEYEMVEKNVAKNFTIPKHVSKEIRDNTQEHMSFTDEEMEKLWQNITLEGVDMLLIQCYMGWRPSELCNIKRSDVHFDEGYIVGGSKTKAGKNRMVPIHPRISELIRPYYEDGREYLFTRVDRRTANHRIIRYQYSALFGQFKNIMQELRLDPNHKLHDPRKHFITMCKKYNVDEYAIKYMVGHAITDITEKVYTDRDIEWLKTEVKKIK